MQTLIISDIHGSEKRLQDVLNTHLDYDNVILVGDLLYHGPRNPLLDDYNPSGVIDLLNAIDKPIFAVRGNCDSEVDQMVLDFPMMSDYTIMHAHDKTIFITHGHVFEPKDASITKANIFISGHTHIPGFSFVNDIKLYNPGSISLPKENHPNTYGYMDENGLYIYDLEHKLYDSYKFKEPR
ncbi:MAG TPA: phosphodiesterase [Erysipelothrix sp.]|nr:phosphodiesterase [Erysipelothrix sp.]